MQRPWQKRAEELEEAEGIYADLCAFEEWLSAEQTRRGREEDEIMECLAKHSDIGHITLWLIFCDVFESLAVPAAQGQEEK